MRNGVFVVGSLWYLCANSSPSARIYVTRKTRKKLGKVRVSGSIYVSDNKAGKLLSKLNLMPHIEVQFTVEIKDDTTIIQYTVEIQPESELHELVLSIVIRRTLHNILKLCGRDTQLSNLVRCFVRHKKSGFLNERIR